jgi:hypothetical protein
MGVTYSAAFDIAAIRDGLTGTDYSFSMTITGAGSGVGYTPITIAPADFVTYAGSGSATRYAHGVDGISLYDTENHEAVPMFQDYGQASFYNALLTTINAKAFALGGWPADAFTISFGSDRYTISRANGTWTFTIQWAESASRWLLGFSADQNTPGTTFPGDLTPMYWINSVMDGRSLDRENDYEPDGIAAIAISDSATSHAGVSRSTAPKMRSWFQHFEPVESVCKSRISGTVRFTFEHLFEHCRCEFPFVVDDGVERMACVFTAEGAVFTGKQRPGGPGDDVHMHVPFNVWHAGDLPVGG